VQSTAVARLSTSSYPVNITSNQFSLSFESIIVYQYVIRITPEEFNESDKTRAIVRTKYKVMNDILGTHFFSGNNIYMLNPLEEDVTIETSFRGAEATILIDTTSSNEIVLDKNFVNTEKSLSQNIINCVIKEAFRQTTLKQIGRSPRFFDIQNPIDLSHLGLKIWPGFKASATQTTMGVTLAIDSIFKFVTTQTCLDRINQLKDQSASEEEFHHKVSLEFCNQSVVADWGNMRTYIVSEVDFTQNPVSNSFEYNGTQKRLAEYF